MNEQIFQAINQWATRYGWLDTAMVTITNYSPLLVAACLLLLFLQRGREGKRTAVYAGLTALLALLLNEAIHLVYHHPRPFMVHPVHQLIPHAADASFPSDHATGAFAAAFPVFFRNRKWGAVMLLVAVLTGFSRIFVGVHYPADVAGGALVAFAMGLLVLRLRRLWEPVVGLACAVYDRVAAVLPFLPREDMPVKKEGKPV